MSNCDAFEEEWLEEEQIIDWDPESGIDPNGGPTASSTAVVSSVDGRPTVTLGELLTRFGLYEQWHDLFDMSTPVTSDVVRALEQQPNEVSALRHLSSILVGMLKSDFNQTTGELVVAREERQSARQELDIAIEGRTRARQEVVEARQRVSQLQDEADATQRRLTTQQNELITSRLRENELLNQQQAAAARLEQEKQRWRVRWQEREEQWNRQWHEREEQNFNRVAGRANVNDRALNDRVRDDRVFRDWAHEKFVEPSNTAYLSGKLNDWLKDFKATVQRERINSRLAVKILRQKSGEWIAKKIKSITRDLRIPDGDEIPLDTAVERLKIEAASKGDMTIAVRKSV